MVKKKNATWYINRELSWLEFNQRVLDRAKDSATPLLERMRFLAITGSNLDEFFMVRVGGLQTLAAKNPTWRDDSGMKPSQQLYAIHQHILKMMTQQYECYEILEHMLAAEGIIRVHPNQLSQEQRQHCMNLFEREYSPLLTPIALANRDRLPLLSNRMLYLGVQLKDGSENTPRLAVVPLAKAVSRFVTLPSRGGGYQFIMSEDLVALYVGEFFPGEVVLACAPMRITRNADLAVREDLALDLVLAMEEILDKRKRSDCVRFEIGAAAPRPLIELFEQVLKAPVGWTCRSPAPIDLSALNALCDLPGYASLVNVPWPPQPLPAAAAASSIFELLSQRDVLLYHPYESFDPVVRFLLEAAADPDVVAIKQVLYRTSRHSPITTALMEAARAGKHVTALVELKARFDEARNIEWAEELEDAGVQVVYGVKGFKTHAKICLVIRRESGMLRRYMHFGTGNYNEITARLYTDVSYMTADEDLGMDASAFFNTVTGYSQPQTYLKLETAPIGLRDRIIDLITAETARAKQGQKAYLRAKFNSLVDPKVIRAMYEASQAGVRIALNIRGICCLRPGLPGLSENISVVSIVDRFLEHSRIFCFCNGGDRRVFFSSADWMPRNFDRRLELLVPVTEPRCAERLMNIVDMCLSDTVSSWTMKSDGSYKRTLPADRKSRVRSQEEFYRQACAALSEALAMQPTLFEPYRSSTKDLKR